MQITSRAWLVAWPCVAIAALVPLWLSLPPGAFFSGDSGLKLAASLNAAAHPGRPFELDLPHVGGHTIPAVDPMVVVHGDHAHALQSPLFPVVSAPLIAAFGLRGAYLLPVLSFVLMLPLLEALRRVAVPDSSATLTAALAVLASPLFFYALEFWEHAPAVALVSAATVLAWHARQRRASTPTGLLLAAGACAGAAVLLRPESVWYAGALALCVTPRSWAYLAAGACVALVPFAVANEVHFGNPLGPHIATFLTPLGRRWLLTRWELIHEWIWQGSVALWVGLLLIVVAWVLRACRLPDPAPMLVGLCGAAVVAVVSALQLVDRSSLWQAFPLAALAFVPPSATDAGARRENALWVLAGVAAAGVVLTATNDGGAQWGPRYLLIATPPLMLVAARRATSAAHVQRLRTVFIALVAVVVLACTGTSRAAYRELRGAKRAYARLVDATRSFTTSDAPVVTNVWWLDQVAGTLSRSRTFLYAPTATEASLLIQQLAGFDPRPGITLVWTEEPDGAPLDHAVDGSCYALGTVHRIPERRLDFAHATCPAIARATAQAAILPSTIN